MQSIVFIIIPDKGNRASGTLRGEKIAASNIHAIERSNIRRFPMASWQAMTRGMADEDEQALIVDGSHSVC